MCKMVKRYTSYVPIWLVLILSICLVGLLAHSFARFNDQVTKYVALELVEDGERDDPDQEIGEDFIVLPELSGLMGAIGLLHPTCPVQIVCASLAAVPLLPPPINN